MLTIILETPGNLVLTRTAPPEEVPPPGEVLLRVHRVGICGTDLHAFRGRQPYFTYPRILGHELGVEVLAVGPGVTDVVPGDHCAVEPYLNCGACVACRKGRPNACVRLRVLGVHIDGGLREQIIVPAHKLHKSEHLALEQLALIETLAIGCHAVERAALQAGETCLIIGAGPIGLAVLEFARLAGARICMLDLNEQRRDFCRKVMGVPHTLAPSDRLERDLRAWADGELPDVVVDATGASASMSTAFGLTGPGGRLVFVGLTIDEVRFQHPVFHKVEGTLLCSRNALPADFPRIIRLIEEERLDTRPWITHRPAFAELPGAFPGFTRPESGCIKAVVNVTG